MVVSEETYLAHTLAAREFGHVIDFSDPSAAAADLRRHLSRPEDIRRRTVRGTAWVRNELSSDVIGRSFIRVYESAIGRRARAH